MNLNLNNANKKMLSTLNYLKMDIQSLNDIEDLSENDRESITRILENVDSIIDTATEQRVFTKREVVEILVANNNKVLKLVDPDKYFVIEEENVLCKRKSLFTRDKVINEYTFDYVIEEAMS
ncbi:MAG: hypothetical protein AB1763_09295 [Campylobacterota bacterium]